MLYKKVVFISSVTSDIGMALAQRYAKEGYIITGTYRSKKLLNKLSFISKDNLFFCDLSDINTIQELTTQFKQTGLKWETFISCASWPPPLTSFFDSDFEKWSASIHINAIEQFRVLYELFPLRNKDCISNVVYFGGPGTNNAVKNFSALTVSKHMLLKFCELLDYENEDLNVFTIGPGWTKTKTHELIINDPNVSKDKKRETLEFIQNHEGTSMDDIFDCIRWLSKKGKSIVGGRNFSVVNDRWGNKELEDELKNDFNMYKFRRYKNNWKEKTKL